MPHTKTPPALYATVPTTPQERQKAMTQEARILAFFEGLPEGKALTPSQVHQFVGGRSPKTSTRRAITNLTERGELVKTEAYRTGPYGRPEHYWRRAVAVVQTDLFGRAA